jgi:hypothetical protein
MQVIPSNTYFHFSAILIGQEKRIMQRRHYGIQKAFFLAVLLLVITDSATAQSESKLSNGQLVYVSTYSNVFVNNLNTKFQLSTLLSIRNTDPKYSITVLLADYFDSDGRKIKRYILSPVRLAPLATKIYFVEPQDTTGGAGANFLVQWEADRPVNQPIIEAVMSNLYNNQGLAFRSPGKVISDHSK